jgi:3-oxoacyl-[acyl-carrier-protein] synthase II
MAQSSKESIVLCLRGALDDAGVEPRQIDYINAHATATIAGDISEAAAIAEVFAGLKIPVSSLKGHMGHTLAASGVLETIASLEMMSRGRLVPTLNLETPDPDLPALFHVPAAGLEKKVIHFIKNSFAFGGINAVLIVKEYTK